MKPYHAKFMSEDFRNLNLDSVWEKKPNCLINIEHHSSLTPDLMRRNYNYAITLFNASKKHVESIIFNTGDIPKNTVIFANELMFYNPRFFNTREKLGIVNLNNLRYKIHNNEELTQNDALDLIWLIKSDIDMPKEDLFYKLAVEIWAKAVAKKWMLDAIRKNLLLWVGKYLKDKSKIRKFKEVMKMNDAEMTVFEKQIIGARISGELERAHESGFDECLNGVVSELSKIYSSEEISKMINIPIEKI